MIYGVRLSLLMSVPFCKVFYVCKAFYVSIGYGLNNILPFRLGDIFKIYVKKRFYGI